MTSFLRHTMCAAEELQSATIGGNLPVSTSSIILL